MPNWEYFDKKALKVESIPANTAMKSGFSVYDEGKYHNHPLYYGMMITDRKTVDLMLKEKVNGGYSFVKSKRMVVMFRSKKEYEEGTKYFHHARAIFGMLKRIEKKSVAMIINEYPELEEETLSLRLLLQKGITIKQLSCVFDKSEDEVLWECYKSLINKCG